MTAAALIEVRMIGLPLDRPAHDGRGLRRVMREFELIRQSDSAAETVPVRLLDLVDELSTRFDEFAEQPRARPRSGAREWWEPRSISCTRCRRRSSTPATGCSTLLDEADDYCLAGEHLVTLASPPEVRSYREWFLREFIEQVAGRSPTPWSSTRSPPNRPAPSATSPRRDSL